MSLCNIIKEPDAIHIYSDSAVYGPTGQVTGFAPKTFLLPGIGAMVVAGDLVVASALALDAMVAPDGFDGVLDRLPDYMTKVFDSLAANGGSYTPQPTVAHLAGWSQRRERLGMWSAAVGETGHHQSGEAFEIVSDILVSPVSSELVTRLENAGLVDDDGMRAETPDQWFAVAQEQRACAFAYEFAGNAPIHMVGGFLQHTVVTRDGLSTRVVHRWANDRIGEKLAP